MPCTWLVGQVPPSCVSGRRVKGATAGADAELDAAGCVVAARAERSRTKSGKGAGTGRDLSVGRGKNSPVAMLFPWTCAE
jgi:hypothetical protein